MWLLLHGFTGSSRSWSHVIGHADLDSAPITPTLMGHGQGWESRAVPSFEGEVARIAHLASSSSRPRLLCGYSMGARLALGLLVRHPGLFDAALLIGMHPGLPSEAARAERRELDARRAHALREDGLEAFVAEWEQLPLFASQRDLPEAKRAEQRGVRVGHDPEGLARSLEVLGLAEMPDYAGLLASIGVPVTLMVGALDPKFASIADSLTEEAPQLLVSVVEGAGHNVVLQAPLAVVSAMKHIEHGVAR